MIRVKTRIQTDVPKNLDEKLKVKSIGARKMFLRILKEQGLGGLYKGFTASMLNTFAMQLFVLLLEAFRFWII